MPLCTIFDSVLVGVCLSLVVLVGSRCEVRMVSTTLPDDVAALSDAEIITGAWNRKLSARINHLHKVLIPRSKTDDERKVWEDQAAHLHFHQTRMWAAKDVRTAVVKRSASELQATSNLDCDIIIRAATRIRSNVGAHVAVVMDPVVVQQAA